MFDSQVIPLVKYFTLGVGYVLGSDCARHRYPVTISVTDCPILEDGSRTS